MAVNITDKLEPKYNTDTYALLEDIYLQGGFRVVSNTTEMNSITEQRKKEGMFVYNLEDKKLYTLKNNTFEIYEVSGIDETYLFNLIKSEDPSVFEVKLDYNDKIILIPKIKKSENLEYITTKSYDIPGLKDEFTEIILDNLKISDMTTSGQEQPLTLNVTKDSYNNIVISGEVTGLQLGTTGLDTFPIENLKNRPSIVVGLNDTTKDWTQLIQYFNFITNSDAKNLSEDMVIRLYQDEISINDKSVKASFIPLMANFTPQLVIILDDTSYLSQAVNLKLNIKAREFYSFNKYLFIETTEKLYRLPYVIENGVGVLKGEIDCVQAGINQLIISTSNFEKHFNLNFKTSTPVDWITTTNGTKVSVVENATSAANDTFYTMLEVTAETALVIGDKLTLNKSFDVNTDVFYNSSISNTKEALDVALSKIDELESGAYSPELIVGEDEFISTRERINNGIAIAHTGTHNAKDIDLNDVGIKYSGSKFPEFKYSLQDEYVLKTSSSTLPLVGSDLKLVKQNGKYRVVGELKDWVGIQNNMLIIPIAYIEGITEEDKFYDTVYFMQQFFNYPSQVISSDLNAVDNAKVLTSEEILIEGIEDELQLTFLTYPQLMMIIFKTDKSNFDITSANIKLSIEQATEDYFDTTLPYMSSNFMSIGKLKFEDVDGEVHIKGTITNRLDKGSPANSLVVSSSGAIIENYFDNMQSPELLNTITSASNTEYNYQIAIDHSGQYGDMCTITLTGSNPIQNDEVITVDIPVKNNKNVSIEKAPENVEEAIKILKDNSISGSIDGSIGILDSKLYSNEYNKRSSLIALDSEISIQGTFNSLDENVKYMDLPIFIDTTVSDKETQFYVANYKNGYRLKGKGVLSKNTTTSIIQIIPSSYGEMDKIKAIAFNLIKPIKPVDIENDINNTEGIMELQPGDSVGDFVSGKIAFVSFLGNLSLLLSGQPTGDFGDIIEFDIGVDPIWSNKVISENFTLNLINKDGSVQLSGDIPAIKSRDETSAAEVDIEFYSPYLKNYFTDGLTIGGISNTNFALYDDLDKSSTTEVSGTFTKSGDYKFLLHLNINGALVDNMLLSFYMDADINETITDQERECVNLTEALKVLSGKIGDAGNIIYDNNSPMPEKVGGYDAGTTFDNVTLLDLLTGLLYPFQYPKFTTFTTTLKKQFKLGEGSGTSLEVTWDTSNKGNIKPNSIEISVDNSGKLNTDTNNSGTETLTITEMKLDSPGTKQATAKLTNTKGTEATASITFSWVNTFYYGNSTKETLSADEIKALTSVDANSISKEITIDGSGYKFIAIPKTWGIKEFNDKDSGLGISLQSPVVETNIENEFTVAQDYYVFRTNQYINGSLTFVLK